MKLVNFLWLVLLITITIIFDVSYGQENKTQIYSDVFRSNIKQKSIYLEGNVRAIYPENFLIYADTLKGNLDESGDIQNSYFSAAKICNSNIYLRSRSLTFDKTRELVQATGDIKFIHDDLLVKADNFFYSLEEKVGKFSSNFVDSTVFLMISKMPILDNIFDSESNLECKEENWKIQSDPRIYTVSAQSVDIDLAKNILFIQKDATLRDDYNSFIAKAEKFDIYYDSKHKEITLIKAYNSFELYKDDIFYSSDTAIINPIQKKVILADNVKVVQENKVSLQSAFLEINY